MISNTNLTTLDSTVSAPPGIVYSTNPRRAEGEDGYSYFVKGPATEIAFAEIAGCLFAAEAGLLVPEASVCRFDEDAYAGTRKVEASMRDISAWLNWPQKIRNFDDLFSIIVVDAWLANNDRNLYNVLGRQTAGSEIELVMIDFEKSKTLRPNPIIESGMVEPRMLWPTGELGRILRQRKPLYPPQAVLERIAGITQDRCTEIIMDVVEQLGPVAWADNSAHALSGRGIRVRQIAEEVWRSN